MPDGITIAPLRALRVRATAIPTGLGLVAIPDPNGAMILKKLMEHEAYP